MKFFLNLVYDALYSFIGMLIGAMLYHTFNPVKEETLFLPFLITMIAMRFVRLEQYFRNRGQSK